MNSKVKKNKQILYDPLIIPRVKQYLEENVHQTYVDVAVMARQLQDRYREYSRRKVGPFRMLVEQAYRTVLHSYGLDSNPTSEDNDNDGSDVEMMEGDTNAATNHLNNTLTDLYSKKTQSSQKSVGELIDISSDESGNEGEKQRGGRSETDVVISKMSDGSTNTLKDIVAKMSKNGARAHDSQTNNSTVIASFGPQGATIHTNKKRKLDANSPARAKTPPSICTSGGGGAGDGVSTTSNLPTNSAATRTKKYKKEVQAKRTTIMFQDLGGLERVLKQLCELLFHMKHPEVYNHIGVDPPRGLLLHGPPGCGKTLLAHAIAGQLDIPIIEVPATELIGGVSGESEERIRDIFEQAGGSAPCVLFIDEIDSISSNRINAQKDMERRIVAQLISSLDALSKLENDKQVLVIGATNRPEALDPALRRVGRFDHEISLGIPDRYEREEILSVICYGVCLETPTDFATIAELTPGYVGADLQALTARAASLAITRAFTNIYQKKKETQSKNITIVDLDEESEAQKESGDKEAMAEADAESEAIPVVADLVEDDESAEVTVIADGDVTESDEAKENAQPPQDESAEDSVQMVEDTTAAKDDATQSNETASEAKAAGEGDLGNDEVVALDVDAVEATESGPTAEADKQDEVTESMEVVPAEEQVADSAQVDEEVLQEADGIVQSSVEKGGENMNEAMDAIDLDQLPDDTQRKENQKKQPVSLNDMLNWLEKDTQAIMGSQLDEIAITLDDFKNAIKLIVPSAKREGFITVPDVTWDDIGSLRDIREELQLAVLAPVKYPSKMKALGLSTPSGVLLCGPPGCGKTLLAKAIANEAGINFISVKGPELMNMYVGESERAVRQCFQRARNSQPCVIFFDEFDSLCPKRSDAADGGSATRVVNQLLTEMDGVEDRKGVFLMAASNRPDIIDPAVLRPGRLDKILYVGLPTRVDRVAIIQALTKKGKVPSLGGDVDLNTIAEKTEGYTGADLAGLIRQASLLRLKESISGSGEDGEQMTVHNKHFLDALSLIKPSVSAEDQKVYERLRLKYAAPRVTQPTA